MSIIEFGLKKYTIYIFIRKHFPKLLGLVNKKKYRKKIASQKQHKLNMCEHKNAYLYDDAGNGYCACFCPNCEKDWLVWVGED